MSLNSGSSMLRKSWNTRDSAGDSIVDLPVLSIMALFSLRYRVRVDEAGIGAPTFAHTSTPIIIALSGA